MSNIARMMQRATAGAGGAGLDVDEVFSTFLYDGTGSAQTITNNIDLSGEGGLVWAKSRTDNGHHTLYDTARGTQKPIFSSASSAQGNDAAGGATNGLNTFNSNGFTIGADWAGNINVSSEDMVSWTFRKAPKFFDVVTYTGDGTSNRAIAHNLGTTPGMVIVKRTSISGSWIVSHNSIGSTDYLNLNATNAKATNSTFFPQAHTSTHFYVGNDGDVNDAPFYGTNRTYVAYLFAHNNNDGEFGPNADQDIIKCGTYTGNGSSTGPVIDLGFEPQFVMVKNSSDTGGWQVMDSMRGIVTDGGPSGNDARLQWNVTNTEGSVGFVDLTPTGFQVTSTGSNMNTNNATYIYMAIRRGPLAAPDDATKVFGIDSNTGQTGMQTGILNDMGIAGGISSTDKWFIGSRLTQGFYLRTNNTDAEPSGASPIWNFDSMNSFFNGTTWNGYIGYGWKRAPSYFDVVAYKGTGSSSARAVPHNLGVVPEMMWVKRRDSNSGEGWAVYHKGLNGGTDPEDYYVSLNSASAEANNFYRWADTAPTATNFYVTDNLDASGGNLIAYLFATLAGVSKVGSYSGTGSDQNIDCGFSSGARFVLTKRYTGNGGWQVRDSARGITTASNDPWLELQGVNAEYQDSNMDIDPLSSGFTVSGADIEINASGHSFIFYAIA